jgi:predicted RecB family nuclease
VSKSRVYNYGLKVPSKYIHFENLDKEYFIICWVASYVGSRKVFSDCVSPAEARRWDDSKILKELRDIMASADIIAGHNVAAYDVKRANTRFLLNDIPSVIATNDKDKRLIDTLKIARSKFAFESNTLDYINQRLGFRPKDDIRNEDWLKIIKTGDEKTLNKVSRYCKGDVVQGKRTLERLMQYGGRKVNYGVTW